MTDFLETNIVRGDQSTNCTWNMGTKCAGRVAVRSMFKKQLEVPICDSHYLDHAMLMVLNVAHKLSIESLIELDPDGRKEKFKQLTGEEEVTEKVMSHALEKVGHDMPGDSNDIITAFITHIV